METGKDSLPEVKSCGFVVVRREPLALLLLKHSNRYDFAKGHMESGEDEMQTALRELREETGLSEQDVDIVPNYRVTSEYVIRYRRKPYNGNYVKKTVVLFMAVLKKHDVSLTLGEHADFAWVDIQAEAHDELLDNSAIKEQVLSIAEYVRSNIR
eukprot:GILK01012790.1.p1 GENE.GILK01012790.1~~GILK01012790.1.p1  ORF type:complete len:167 (-),score=27.99 GILK01012790.1:204-668(-)